MVKLGFPTFTLIGHDRSWQGHAQHPRFGSPLLNSVLSGPSRPWCIQTEKEVRANLAGYLDQLVNDLTGRLDLAD